MLMLLLGAFLGLGIFLFSPNLVSKIKIELESQLWVVWLFSIFFISIYFVGIEVSLFYAMLITAIFYFYDWFKLNKQTKKGKKRLLYHVVDFFPILLIIWLIRSFLFQPYHVPTGSLEPTVRPGDFLLVNQYEYGLRMPIWRNKLFEFSQPKRGDLVVFFPPGGHVHFVKRLIGLPGDVIKYNHKQLYINGKEMTQDLNGPGYAQDPGAPVIEKTENLDGVNHRMFINPAAEDAPEHTWIVPSNHYFMMGDNRDFSGDSREFGFVPDKNIVGKPMFIWFSIDSKALHALQFKDIVRWNRIGEQLS